MDLFRRMELDIYTPDDILPIDSFLPKPEDLPSLLEVKEKDIDTVLMYNPMEPTPADETMIEVEEPEEKMEESKEGKALDEPAEPTVETENAEEKMEEIKEEENIDHIIRREEFRTVDLRSDKIDFELDDLPMLDEEDIKPMDFGNEIDRLDL